MMDIKQVKENQKVYTFLQKRGLWEMYKRKRELLLFGYDGKIDFKLRKPRKEGVYAFRINKQYRAFGKLLEGTLFVYMIDDHQ